MPIRSNIIVFDFETGGRNPHKCQPTQLAALALNGVTFECKASFNSEIWAETDDEKAVEKGLAPLEAGALKVTGKTREQIAKAPKPKVVWAKFVSFVQKYNIGNTQWGRPVPCGYNIVKYDLPIIDRLAKAFGPWDENYLASKLFHPTKTIDMLHDMYMWTEADPNVSSISMDNVRKRMGMSEDNAHDALQDVKDTANIMIKFMNAKRAIYKKLEIDDCFAKGGLYIE